MLYAHNFSRHRTPRYITVKTRSLFCKSLMDKGVWSVMHLLIDNGTIMSYNEFSFLSRTIQTNMFTQASNLFQDSSCKDPILPKRLINRNEDFILIGMLWPITCKDTQVLPVCGRSGKLN